MQYLKQFLGSLDLAFADRELITLGYDILVSVN